MDGVNNIMNRINQIQGMGKNLKNFKPEAVNEFSKMYQSAISNSTEKEESKAVHPLLRKQPTKEIPKIEKKKIDTFSKSSVESDKGKAKKNVTTNSINDIIKEASRKYKIPEDLLKAVIYVESRFDTKAVSHAGAMGLMQLMPFTAEKMGVIDPFDVTDNINGGAKYLSGLLERYEGDLDKALAAYNAGPHRVDNADGVPDIKETMDYVTKIRKLLLK